MSETLYTDFLERELALSEKKLYAYVLFDGVKHPSVYKELINASLHNEMLFTQSSLRNQLKEVAPYIIALDFKTKDKHKQSSNFLKLFEKEEALMMTSTFDFTKQVKNMQDIFHLIGEDGSIESYLRFYDVQVFDALMQTQDKDMLNGFFTGTQSYWFQEEPSKQVLTQYAYKNNMLAKTNIELTQTKGKTCH